MPSDRTAAMPRTMQAAPSPTGLASSAWVVLFAGTSVLASFALACATPLAALAAVAGTRLSRRDAFAAVTLAWAGNQIIGFALLHYPRTLESLGWGAAMEIAALAATAAACACARRGRPAATAVLAVLLACAVYEGGLFAATAVLPASDAAFSAPTVARIVLINAAVAFGLFVLAWLGSLAVHPRRTPSRAARGT